MTQTLDFEKGRGDQGEESNQGRKDEEIDLGGMGIKGSRWKGRWKVTELRVKLVYIFYY